MSEFNDEQCHVSELQIELQLFSLRFVL